MRRAPAHPANAAHPSRQTLRPSRLYFRIETRRISRSRLHRRRCCKLVSRNSNQFKSFGSLRDSLSKIHAKNAILDGEVVCLDANGVSQFNDLLSRKGKPVFYAFDLMWLDGEDLRKLPLIERKQRLCNLVQRSKCERIIYAQHVETQGVAFFNEICSRDLEGIVAKRKLSAYKNNGTGWLKIKNPAYSQAEGRQELFEKA
jgi:bifunctional non-homologous end joining protein LigD